MAYGLPKKMRNALPTRVLGKEVIKYEERYAEFEALRMDKDHIQILCSAHPKVAAGEIVRIFKSITAKQVFIGKSEVKRDLWGGEFWTDGYYVATVGERANGKAVENCIERQGKPIEEWRQLNLFD